MFSARNQFITSLRFFKFFYMTAATFSVLFQKITRRLLLSRPLEFVKNLTISLSFLSMKLYPLPLIFFVNRPMIETFWLKEC